ncbi:MAG: phosphatidate cytidylyltransferase, partial [Rhodoplanes sp.]
MPAERGPANAFARIVSALVLAPLAIAAVLIGGRPFVLFWSVAAIGVYWEWSAEIVRAPRSAQTTGAAVLAAAGALAAAGYPGAAVLVIAAGAGALAALAKENR